jgi:hypothetical protein
VLNTVEVGLLIFLKKLVIEFNVSLSNNSKTMKIIRKKKAKNAECIIMGLLIEIFNNSTVREQHLDFDLLLYLPFERDGGTITLRMIGE